MKSRIEKWQRWSKRIVDEVGVGISDRRTWHEVRSLWKSNAALHVPSEVPDWIARMYAGNAALAIRRQVDMRTDVVSLARLLTEITKFASDLTWPWYSSHYEPRFPRDIVRRNFAKWEATAGPHVDPAIPRRDLKSLHRAAERARRFANKRIAHSGKGAFSDPPTYGEIDRLLKRLERLAVKYYALLTGSSFIDDSLEPTRQFNHATILRRPWMPAQWKRARWPPGWMERRGELWPIPDWLKWGDYRRLFAAQDEIRSLLSERLKSREPDESPIRSVLTDLSLPATDAAVMFVRDSLQQHGETWRIKED